MLLSNTTFLVQNKLCAIIIIAVLTAILNNSDFDHISKVGK